ncbi:NAD(P)H:quinone oxidoreductase [Marinicella litoralis]|uniref:NAD(P)H dehydrogenase (Quinone) n=1 Tax=Marinicella litoralis TaxID=644220 RepID=A0A4R6XN94_9GAMM|nr:NAD(P)H:quinone oxidoreductase [Marinicella litoralis]TDR19610.1 NAD(P)H dehydrogenase (quinone) [Marinicella litoralis]
MTKVLVLYFSKRGNTQKMARLMARGVESIDGCEAMLRTVESDLPDAEKPNDVVVCEQDMIDCDAILLGSPSYFGNMASPLKRFIDSTGNLWFSGAMEGKPAGVFATASSLHGGQETTLINMMIPLLHFGMVIVGLPYSEKSLLYTQSGGSPYGATHWAEMESNRSIDHNEKQLCLAQGKRIAEFAKKLRTT